MNGLAGSLRIFQAILLVIFKVEKNVGKPPSQIEKVADLRIDG